MVKNEKYVVMLDVGVMVVVVVMVVRVELVVVVVVVVMVVVMVHQVVDGRTAVGARAAAAGLGFLAPAGRWAAQQADPHARCPGDLGQPSGCFPEDIHEVLEQLLVAAAGLGEAGQGAGVGKEPHTLLPHQLAFPLFGL